MTSRRYDEFPFKCSKCKDRNWLIECICGYCNDVIFFRDSYGFLRNYKKGHATNGKNSPNYKGEQNAGQCYKCLVRRHHKYADKRGRVKKHRYEMELHIGRYLKPTEDVHHINGIRDDNRIENLQVLLHSEHSRITMASKFGLTEKEYRAIQAES